MDGYDEDRNGAEHYWHCEEPAVTEVAGAHIGAGSLWLCAEHAADFADHEADMWSECVDVDSPYYLMGTRMADPNS